MGVGENDDITLTSQGTCIKVKSSSHYRHNMSMKIFKILAHMDIQFMSMKTLCHVAQAT